ncbi:hypothetical protein ABZ733_38795, partial [Streptomyces longwoodensis]
FRPLLVVTSLRFPSLPLDTAGNPRDLRAGAGLVAGVRTGAHDARTLRAAGAGHVLDSVADLPALLRGAD